MVWGLKTILKEARTVIAELCDKYLKDDGENGRVRALSAERERLRVGYDVTHTKMCWLGIIRLCRTSELLMRMSRRSHNPVVPGVDCPGDKRICCINFLQILYSFAAFSRQSVRLGTYV